MIYPTILPLYLGSRNAFVAEAVTDSAGNLLTGAVLKYLVREREQPRRNVPGPSWPLDATEDVQVPGDYLAPVDAPELLTVREGDRLQLVLYRVESGSLEPIEIVVNLVVRDRSSTI